MLRSSALFAVTVPVPRARAIVLETADAAPLKNEKTPFLIDPPAAADAASLKAASSASDSVRNAFVAAAKARRVAEPATGERPEVNVHPRPEPPCNAHELPIAPHPHTIDAELRVERESVHEALETALPGLDKVRAESTQNLRAQAPRPEPARDDGLATRGGTDTSHTSHRGTERGGSAHLLLGEGRHDGRRVGLHKLGAEPVEVAEAANDRVGGEVVARHTRRLQLEIDEGKGVGGAKRVVSEGAPREDPRRRAVEPGLLRLRPVRHTPAC